MANYQRVGVVQLSTGLVQNVIDVDTDTQPPNTWPSNWITSVGKLNNADVGTTYVPLFNGFVPPQPNPTFILRTSDLTWQPESDIFYFWNDSPGIYYLWDPYSLAWTPLDTLPPGSQSDEITIVPFITYNLTKSADTVLPGGTIDITLSITGPSEPAVVPYEIIGTSALENVFQTYDYTVDTIP